ncbi:hypothetical protein [Trinickia soli]|uniref:hypothetical protein n=1 Tax=Trinickia soli TaxID=380675 RepID=UPI003FA3B6D0
MSLDSRWKVFAALGTGAFALGLYALWNTLLYMSISGDATGTTFFGCAAFCLLLVAGLHWYMAAGFKYGALDLVTGTLVAATLQQGSRVVVSATRIQFIRKLDADNLTLTPENRYVFFVCAYRPWVCKEAQFQVA